MLRTGGRAGDQDSGVHIGSRGAVNTGDQGYNSLHMGEKAIKKRENWLEREGGGRTEI